MPTTHQGKKLGKRTLRVTVFRADAFEVEAETIAAAEYPERSKGLAKAFANRKLGEQTPPTEDGCYFWARIELGEYTDNSWDDDRVGWMTDAMWERDDSFEQIFAYLNTNHTIDWS